MKKRKLLLATFNPGKAFEIKKFLENLPFEIFSLEEAGIKISFPEKGASFIENARGKSIFYSLKSSGLTLSEDSGLEVEYLDGAPGVFSSRYAGPKATDDKNIEKLLRVLKNVPDEKRKARFVSCMVLAQRGSIIKEFMESVSGYITMERRGNYGFGYDPVFYYPPLERTFGELLPQEKNRISHRGQALRKLRSFLLTHLAGEEMA
ncbi:MAG: RdgB/HAM1 family non-canonical purine NTP pyrophosphatase [Candidatus Aminicenantales bacterium]